MPLFTSSHKSDPDTKDPRGIRTGEKLSALRKLMKDEPEPLDYYIIPSADAHQSEYIAVVDARVEYISDFTGSSALAIVSTASAHLFVDSRYWIQAARETDNKYWTVHRVGAPGEKSWTEWIKQDANPKSTFGVDARLISYKTVPQLFSGISERGSRLLFPQTNLIDASRSDQPPLPNNPITVHPLKYAGQPASAKIKQIREWLVSQQRSPERSSVFEVLPGELPDESGYPSKTSHTFADVAGVTATLTGVVLYALDTIAWTLNLRGEDVPFNPVFFAYLIITQEEAILFTEAGKIESQSVQSYLEALGVAIRPYERVWSYLQSDELKATMILDSNTPYAVAASVTRPRYTVINYSYVTNLKGIKNDTEIGGFRAAYLRDAAAFVQWSAWLEEAIVKKKKSVTEWEAALQLGEYRKQLDHYRGLAYGDISATGANAALPHYTPSDKDSPMIETSTPYLMDSGGQYLDGTCDTTRTVHFGDPTKEQREAYTRVLQGHIAIETAVFPSGTTGAQLDVLARKALWKDGMNYGVSALLWDKEAGISFLALTHPPQLRRSMVPGTDLARS
ncbi:hypothetical protein FRB94_000434 [Tulasnella sp. JGI-2019a]|nr:hypothetical protein FRB94_000434 [Tulasnella sp. JGI-2019a]